MKKKIVCLLLALLMVLPLLVGCSNDDDISNINKEAERYTNTLNVWLITESKLVVDASAVILSGITPRKESLNLLSDAEKATLAAMSEEQKAAWYQVGQITEKVNALTKANYRTQLNLKYFLEADYYAAVEAAFAKHEENIAAGNVQTENKTEETILNEYGIPELKYPSIPDYVVDILFIGNQEKYTQYANNEWLADMQAHLSDSAIKLNSYVSSTYLTAAAINGMIYAIPNNHSVGEYVYMLADKNLMKDFTDDLSGSTIYDSEFKAYLDYVYENYTGADKIYPIYSETGKIDIDYAHYWSFDVSTDVAKQNPDRFSIFGDAYPDTSILENKNLLTDSAYMKALANKVYYEATDGYLTTDKDAKAAVKIVKGSYEKKAQYEKEGYEVMVVQYPQLTDAEIYKSMFGIGAYSVSEKRAAEVLTYINTDTEIRNLLQYGIEDVNYTLEPVYKKDAAGEDTTEVDGYYAKPTKDNLYEMDLEKTGNTLIAYPNDPDDIHRHEYDTKQNFEMVIAPTLGMNFTPSYKIDKNSILVMDAVSAKLWEVIGNMQTSAEVETMHLRAVAAAANGDWQMTYLIREYIGEGLTYVDETGATKEITNSVLRAAIVALKVTAYNSNEGGVQSPYYLYTDWCAREGVTQ
ncbi:MAG: hypothetical protein IKC75_02925 [Clostridia bacterium]|nr:hypothetical protein [Clostridia bacterium]